MQLDEKPVVMDKCVSPGEWYLSMTAVLHSYKTYGEIRPVAYINTQTKKSQMYLLSKKILVRRTEQLQHHWLHLLGLMHI